MSDEHAQQHVDQTSDQTSGQPPVHGGATSRGPGRGQRAAEAPDRKRESALQARLRGIGRQPRLAAGLAGTGVVALVVATVTVGSLAQPTSPEVDGTATPASLNAVPAQGVCAGPPRLPAGAAEGTDTEFSPVSTSAQSRVTSLLLSDLAGRFPGSTLRPLQSAESGGAGGTGVRNLTTSQPPEVQQGEPATAGEDGVPVREATVRNISKPGGASGEASVVTVEPIGGQAARAHAVAQYSASDGDLAGLDTSTCMAPAHEHWLTGMTTTVGSTAILVLSNPSASASTVDLSLHGAEGLVEAPGTNGIVLAPGQTRSIVLGGVAPDENHLAVHVNAQGGAVGATVQQHRLYGLTPGGVEIIQPTAAPSRTAVMPGFVVPSQEDTTKITAQNGYEAAGPAVMIAAPTVGTTATVAVNGPDGPVDLPNAGTVDLEAGAAVRYPLDGLDRSTYTVTVTADDPVVASAQGVTGQAGQPLDISAVPSVGSLGLERLVARPPGATANLVMYSAGGGSVELTPVFADGSVGAGLVQEVRPESSWTVNLDRLPGGGNAKVIGVVLATEEGDIHAGMSVRTAQGISAYPVLPQAEAASGVPVRVGY
jgi:hypothetical protein